MGLAHCSFSPVNNVVYQLLTIRQENIVAIYVFSGFLVHYKKMIPTRSPADINILAEFNVAISTQDGKPAISPGRKPIRGVPIHPYIAVPPISPQNHLPEIFEARELGIFVISYRRGHYFSSGGPGKEQK